MIHSGQTKDLFLLQTELVDMKVDMAVSRTIDRVVDQISALRSDMNSQISNMNSQIHELRHEMRDEFALLKTRVSSIETNIGIVSDLRKEVRSRWLDYCFKAGWVLLCLGASYLAVFLRSYV